MGIRLEQLLTARILRWRREADTLHERGVDEAAEVIEVCADGVESDLTEWRDLTVSDTGLDIEA